MDCDRAAVRPPRLRGRSGRPRGRVNVLGNDVSLAGFQVVIGGRFWVFTEDIMKVRRRYLTRGNPKLTVGKSRIFALESRFRSWNLLKTQGERRTNTLA